MREVELLTGELQERVAADTPIQQQPIFPNSPKDAPNDEDQDMSDELVAVDFGFLSPEEFESEIGAFEAFPTDVAPPTIQDPEAWKSFIANQATLYNAIAARNNTACQAHSSVRNGFKSVLSRVTSASAGGKLMVKRAKTGVIKKLV